jgi:DNA-binding XRE family transcriptional regulator
MAGRNGRPPFEPAEKDQRTVQAMAACGMPQEDIARVLGISKPTLQKHFRETLNTAAISANAKVAATLFQMATSGTNPAATFFWAKCRMRWKESVAVEHTGANGEPIAVQLSLASVLKDLDADLEAIARRASSDAASGVSTQDPGAVSG